MNTESILCEQTKIKLTPAMARLKDLAAASVFAKRPEHAEIFWDMAEARGLGEFPGVCVVADICRDELLFEIDAEAAFVPSAKREEYGNE
jgi:hypothetical protein